MRSKTALWRMRYQPAGTLWLLWRAVAGGFTTYTSSDGLMHRNRRWCLVAILYTFKYGAC